MNLGLLLGTLQSPSPLVHAPHKPLLYSYLAVPPIPVVVAEYMDTQSELFQLCAVYLFESKLSPQHHGEEETHTVK